MCQPYPSKYSGQLLYPFETRYGGGAGVLQVPNPNEGTVIRVRVSDCLRQQVVDYIRALSTLEAKCVAGRELDRDTVGELSVQDKVAEEPLKSFNCSYRTDRSLTPQLRASGTVRHCLRQIRTFCNIFSNSKIVQAPPSPQKTPRICCVSQPD